MNLKLEFPQLSRRLSQFIVALGIVGTGLAGLLGGWQWAAGFLLGAAASYGNFWNLKQVVSQLGTAKSSGRVGGFAWMLFRLILLFAASFVIIRVSSITILAVFSGLFTPVAAILLEAIFELTYARRRNLANPHVQRAPGGRRQ